MESQMDNSPNQDGYSNPGVDLFQDTAGQTQKRQFYATLAARQDKPFSLSGRGINQSKLFATC
jgi:hypothetical protein